MVTLVLLHFKVYQVVGNQSILRESDYDWYLLTIWLIGMIAYSI